MKKNIYCIRHGLAEHNVLYEKYGDEAHFYEDYVDTSLVSEGIQQATNLGEKIISMPEINNIELIIVSPLKRTLQTCENIFTNTNIPKISLEEVREYPCGLHTCNKRESISLKKQQFININFDYIKNDKDLLWNSDRLETLIELDSRVNMFKEFLKSREESNIVVISHCDFLSKLMYGKIQQLKHCEIYKYQI